MAEWKPFDLTWGRSIYYCSECEESVDLPTAMGKPIYKYCPMCGAKMKGADRKTEPQTEPLHTCSVNGRPYSECSSCEHFRCMADRPQMSDISYKIETSSVCKTKL